jgi:hypothetical protein
MASPINADNSVKDLYDYLLQREYADPLSLDHAMQRKAVRSPSLRLRFGRRSDPDMPLRNFNEIENEIEQKSIRSPSLRLRFGRRSDPLMSLFNDNFQNFLSDEPLRRKAQRAPSVRLRFGRSDPTLQEDEISSNHPDETDSTNQINEN